LFSASQYALTNLPPDYFHMNGVEFHGLLQLPSRPEIILPTSSRPSARANAREITTEELGSGLDDVLRAAGGSAPHLEWR